MNREEPDGFENCCDVCLEPIKGEAIDYKGQYLCEICHLEILADEEVDRNLDDEATASR